MKQLLVGFALLLLGTAQQPSFNPVYTPFVGTWDCTRPTPGRMGWSAILNVEPTRDGKLEFTATKTNVGGSSPLSHFYVSYNRDTGEWTQFNPMYPFEKTGVFHNGTIVFSDPEPLTQHFRLDVSANDQTMTWLTYEEPTQVRNYTNEVVRCQRR